jgi:hypothetical protein
VTAAPDPLCISLSSWIIQDGNYGDFARRDIAAFALEFFPHGDIHLAGRTAEPRSLLRLSESRYAVSGDVIHVAADWWAIDVGIGAFREDRPPLGMRKGDQVLGEVTLGIDPFFYFERLCEEPGAPALIYDWRIEKIELQTAPWIEVRPRWQERDPKRLGWREIDRTAAWRDDDGNADYLLHCTRLAGRPRRTNSSAIQ